MQVVAKIDRVEGVVGALYLERIGFTWKIKARVNGKMEIVARSYYYTTDKQKALDALENNYRVITGFQHDLFN